MEQSKIMKVLFVSGYAAWKKVSKYEMPSHHLFGFHELIDHYEDNGVSLRGILKKEPLGGGYVDFYLWHDGKENIIKQCKELLRLSRNYDIVYDVLNRCSVYLGIAKKLHLFKTSLVTVMHHPPYTLQLKLSDSDAYIFFDNEYRDIANRANRKKTSLYYVNEWKPDINWYMSNSVREDRKTEKCFYIDNGKSRRDKDVLISAANKAEIRVDYAADEDGASGWARPYKMNLKNDIAQLKKLREYKAIIIPIRKENKEKIGPLGITSYLDAIALGIPVIASDNVCFAKEIRRKNIGLLYETGNDISLKDQMECLYNNSELYEMMANNIRANEMETIDNYSLRLSLVLSKIINKQ